MSKKNIVLICFMLSIQLLAQSTGVQDADAGRIRALENAWNEAIQEKNRSALDLLLGPELVLVDHDGLLMNKANYIVSVISQELHPSRVVNEAMTVNLFGPVAVVSGLYRENGIRRGKPYQFRERFTDTWIRRNESWICIASQSTLIRP